MPVGANPDPMWRLTRRLGHGELATTAPKVAVSSFWRESALSAGRGLAPRGSGPGRSDVTSHAMASSGPNPISAEAARKALNPDQERAAHAHDVAGEQAQLDEAELRELERSNLYGETPRARQPSRLRSIIDRMLGR